MVVEIHTEEGYHKALEKSKEKLVVIDFYADWCGPCRMVAPHIAKIGDKYDKDVEIYKINVETLVAIASELNIRAMPTFKFFKNGVPLEDDNVVGANHVSVENTIKKLIQSEL